MKLYLSRCFKILLLSLFVCFGFHAYASLEITEIMYDPKGANTDHQWIEVYNPDANAVSVDASTWRFSDGSGHYMNDKVDFSIPAGAYIIITGNKTTFLSDHSLFSGTVIDTSMSLDKDGDTVALANNGTTIASVSYSSSMGGSEDGNSLQKINGTFQGAIPTPGLANQTTASVGSSVQASSSTKDEEEEEVQKIITIATKIISPTRVTVNIPFPISSKTTTSAKEILGVGKFVWNFGDGVSKTRETAEPFEYMYTYPGDYVVTLSFYQSVFSVAPEATDKFIVKVLPAGVRISGVGNSSDPYIELENNSSSDVDVSKWILKGAVHTFMLPEGSIVLSSKKIRLSPKITGFDFSDFSNIFLQSPTGEVLGTYPLSRPAYSSGSSLYSYASTNVKSGASSRGNLSEINLNDLGASVGNTRLSSKNNNKSVSVWPFIGLAGIIGIGISAIILLGNKKDSSNELDDIRAEDMTIIE